MAEIDASQIMEVDTDYDLDESRSYSIVSSHADSTVEIDGGGAAPIGDDVVVVVGPGVGKATLKDGAASLIPRSDSRM